MVDVLVTLCYNYLLHITIAIMPATKNIVPPSGRQLEKVIIADVEDCDEVRVQGQYTFEYPYKIKITDTSGIIVSNEPTSPQYMSNKWSKKFYVSKRTDKNTGEIKKYVSYTRNEVLLAVSIIMQKYSADMFQEIVSSLGLDINGMIGYEFEAIVVRPENGDDNTPFIDWTATFEALNINVPTVAQLEPVRVSEEGGLELTAAEQEEVLNG